MNEKETLVLEEVEVIPAEVVSDDERENPITTSSVKKYLSGATFEMVAGGAAGAFATAAVPAMFKEQVGTGWKKIAVSVGVAVVGGYLTGKLLSKQAGVGWIVAGAGISLLQAIHQLTGRNTYFDGIGAPNMAGDEDFIYDVGDDGVFGVDGVGSDDLIPSAIGDFY